ncbi:hypothetical protein Tco_0036592 [Tanacetum coccineum]
MFIDDRSAAIEIIIKSSKLVYLNQSHDEIQYLCDSTHIYSFKPDYLLHHFSEEYVQKLRHHVLNTKRGMRMCDIKANDELLLCFDDGRHLAFVWCLLDFWMSFGSIALLDIL